MMPDQTGDTMPTLAQHVVIDHVGKRLLVDGVEFPWMMTEAGPTMCIGEGSLPLITLTLIAENAEVITAVDRFSFGELTAAQPGAGRKAPDDAGYWIAGRDNRGDIRLSQGRGALVAMAFDTRAEIESWLHRCDHSHFRRQYLAALALLDAEEAFARACRQRHTWECANRTRIGDLKLDACDCPEEARNA